VKSICALATPVSTLRLSDYYIRFGKSALVVVDTAVPVLLLFFVFVVLVAVVVVVALLNAP